MAKQKENTVPVHKTKDPVVECEFKEEHPTSEIIHK